MDGRQPDDQKRDEAELRKRSGLGPELHGRLVADVNQLGNGANHSGNRSASTKIDLADADHRYGENGRNIGKVYTNRISQFPPPDP